MIFRESPRIRTWKSREILENHRKSKNSQTLLELFGKLKNFLEFSKNKLWKTKYTQYFKRILGVLILVLNLGLKGNKSWMRKKRFNSLWIFVIIRELLWLILTSRFNKIMEHGRTWIFSINFSYLPLFKYRMRQKILQCVSQC